MNAIVVDFSKKRIEQLKREIADLEIIIIEFGGKNERRTKPINSIMVKTVEEEKRGLDIYRGFSGNRCGHPVLYSDDRRNA